MERINQEVLKQAQVKFKEKFGDFRDKLEDIQIFHYKDYDTQREKVGENLWNRLEFLLKEMDGMEAPRWNNRENFDQAVKITYILNHHEELENAFYDEYPQYQDFVKYLLAFGIRSGDAIREIAPEYNELLG